MNHPVRVRSALGAGALLCLAGAALAAAMAMAADAPAAAAAAQPGHPPPAQEAALPFANYRDSILDWRADGEQGIWVQGVNRQWYYARFMGPCIGLNFATAVGFRAEPNGQLDKFGFPNFRPATPPIRINPKISENPAESRNSNPPRARLFRVWMIQNCISGAGPGASPAPETVSQDSRFLAGGQSRE
jgi:hypothetical protein